MNVTDKVTAQISLHVIDIVALRKLVLVSYALAGNLGGAATASSKKKLKETKS